MDYSGIADKGKFKVEKKKRIWGKTPRLIDTIRMTGSALLVMDYPSVSRVLVCSKLFIHI